MLYYFITILIIQYIIVYDLLQRQTLRAPPNKVARKIFIFIEHRNPLLFILYCVYTNETGILRRLIVF